MQRAANENRSESRPSIVFLDFARSIYSIWAKLRFVEKPTHFNEHFFFSIFVYCEYMPVADIFFVWSVGLQSYSHKITLGIPLICWNMAPLKRGKLISTPGYDIPLWWPKTILWYLPRFLRNSDFRGCHCNRFPLYFLSFPINHSFIRTFWSSNTRV